MADEKPESSAPAEGQTLGQFLTAARERRGLTRAQAIAEAHIPEHYLKMIESGDYGLVSDQLYLVPYIRRYAAFVGLDAEEMASRFIRDLQAAEINVVRIAEPFTMVTHKSRGQGLHLPATWLMVLLAAALLIVVGLLAIRRGDEGRPAAVPAIPPPVRVVKSPAPTPAPRAPALKEPPAAAATANDAALPPSTLSPAGGE